MAGESGAKSSGTRESIYLIDGTYTVFRSFFAIGPLTAPDGTPTSAVFGLINTIRKIIRDREPEHIAVAFDLEGPTHRDEVYEQYKANRPPPPEDLVPQFPLALEACRVLGWPEVTAEGFEADDVIATLARKAKARDLDVVIVTADKDLYQLVDDRVTVLNPAKNDRLLDPAGVADVFGAGPEQVVDVLALMGDKVDNVPGVPGIGEKTAKNLVRRYKGLDPIRHRARMFAEVWEIRERALGLLDSADTAAARDVLEQLIEPAAALAELERSVGGDDGALLASKFDAVSELAGRLSELKPRERRKPLKELEKKTQPKIWLSIAENDEQLELSRHLVTINSEAPVELDLEDMRLSPPDAPAAADLFRRLGFHRLTEEMESCSKASLPAASESLRVEVLNSIPKLEAALTELGARQLIALDTETDSLRARDANLVGVSLAGDASNGAYLPVGHRETETDAPQLPWDEARLLLQPFLEDPSVGKTGQNLKYDLAVLRRAGVVVEGVVFDTLIAALLLDPGRTSSHKLEDLAVQYLGESMIRYEDVAGSGDAEVTLDLVEIERVARYAVEDAVVSLRLSQVLERELRARDLHELFVSVEMPLLPVLEEMEHVGIRLEVKLLAELSSSFQGQLERLTSEIHELAGHEFNINSPQQLRTVLFDELDLRPTGRRTQKTRKHSTGQESLEALSKRHPLPGKILEYRELSKLKSTYVDALPRLVGEDGRVHGQFHQLGAATGRLSSSDPNLQNIPVRTELGRKIRAAFVPEPGWTFISADYSQMELRILGHLSDDPTLIDAFERDVDIHVYTAALVAGQPMDRVTPEMRARAKAVNFGIVYGMSEFRLAREQGMTRDEAREFIAAYFDRYPHVKTYIDGVIEDVQKTGEVRTLYGRVRTFPELAPGSGRARLSHPAREQLLRQAVNTTVQGTGADIVKKAMVRVRDRLRHDGLQTRMVLQVHDELLLEAPAAEAGRAALLVREEMEGAARLSIPLKVDVRMAGDWSAAH